EPPAFAAFLPRLCARLTGENLKLANIATWWCGQAREAAEVAADLDNMLIAPAFGVGTNVLSDGEVLGSAMSPEQRAALIADFDRRPQDYVGREVVRLSTMPVVTDR